jgi:hypothetical protein
MTEATQEQQCTMPTPGAEHERLEPFTGKFKAEVKMWMGPGDPHVSMGTMNNSRVLGGLYLAQDYVGDAADPAFPGFLGKGFWGFNPVTRKYEGFWIDNASSIMQLENGDVDASGKVWTMHSEVPCPPNGDLFKKRSVITLIDEDHHRIEMYFTGQDGNEMKCMEISYQRI